MIKMPPLVQAFISITILSWLAATTSALHSLNNLYTSQKELTTYYCMELKNDCLRQLNEMDELIFSEEGFEEIVDYGAMLIEQRKDSHSAPNEFLQMYESGLEEAIGHALSTGIGQGAFMKYFYLKLLASFLQILFLYSVVAVGWATVRLNPKIKANRDNYFFSTNRTRDIIIGAISVSSSFGFI